MVVKRKSKFTLIQKVSSNKSEEVRDALVSMMQSVKDKIHTITADNDKEFTKHKALNTDFFSCYPYFSWERAK